MITNQSYIEVSGIPVEVVRKDIKNLHLGVYPPNGRVRIAIPLRLDEQDARMAVVSRIGWIRRQQDSFLSQRRQSEREMVTGESHYYLGHRYRLDVVEQNGPAQIKLVNKSMMVLSIRPGASQHQKEAVLNRWYRSRLHELVPPLISKWEPIIGVRIARYSIRKMKTRWGTCNTETGAISLNLELAKKPASSLEFILVHELVHLLERHHNKRFIQLMDSFLPQWRLYRDELNQSPLAHENWGY